MSLPAMRPKHFGNSKRRDAALSWGRVASLQVTSAGSTRQGSGLEQFFGGSYRAACRSEFHVCIPAAGRPQILLPLIRKNAVAPESGGDSEATGLVGAVLV